jgi:uncharacterized protein YjbJ (UPF0337 family)
MPASAPVCLRRSGVHIPAQGASTLADPWLVPAQCSLSLRGSTMAKNESGPEAGAKGVVEGVKGSIKEAAGALAGDDRLKAEGRAQQDKADAQRDVSAKEAEAEKARATADAYEAEQRAHQKN